MAAAAAAAIAVVATVAVAARLLERFECPFVILLQLPIPCIACVSVPLLEPRHAYQMQLNCRIFNIALL